MPPLSEQIETTSGSHPETTLERTAIYMDPDHPFDALILDYKRKINRNLTPTPAEQRAVTIGIRQGIPDATEKLLEINRGFLAALAHPYRAMSFDNTEILMSSAEAALLEASFTYSPTSDLSFTNFSIPIIDSQLAEQFGATEPLAWQNSQYPINDLYRVMECVTSGSQQQVKLQRQQDHYERLKTELLLKNAYFLQYINLPNVEFEEKMGWDISTMYKRMKDICTQLHIPNRRALALACLEVGIEFETPPIPDASLFTRHQLEVAQLSHLSYDEICKELNLTFAAVNKTLKLVRDKLGARSLTESTIMTRVGKLAPPEYDGPEYLGQFTPFQRQIIPYLHLENTDYIIEQTGASKYPVEHAIQSMMEMIGVSRRRQLALYLQNQGYNFDIVEPKKQLDLIANERTLHIWQDLGMNDNEITEKYGMDISRLHYDIHRGKELTGARNRTELLLLSHRYAHGEFTPAPEIQTKQEKLASKLGLLALDNKQLDNLLARLGERQRTLIKAYYFSDETVSWQTIAETYGLDRTLSIVTARSGVIRMKRMLDEETALTR